MASPDSVRSAVGAVIDPELRIGLGDAGMVADVTVDGAAARIDLRLTVASCPKRDLIEREVRDAALAVGGVESVEVVFGVMSDEERSALTARVTGGRTPTDRFGPNSLTRVIGVTSGKGGVGKSTLAVNLAVAMAARGRSVGLLDADVHGFSVPALLGIEGQQPTKVGDLMMPPRAFDVGVISIGMFVEPHTAVTWRGPMLHRTLSQFLSDVHFGDLDVLVVDLPPGTGDVALSFGQLLPAADILVVTTPQIAASDVAERSGLSARQLGQRVVGVIENMSDWVGDDGDRHHLFGSGGGTEVATRLGVPLLGTIPLTPGTVAAGDRGVPLVVANPTDRAALAMTAIVDVIDETAMPRGSASLPLTVRT